MGNPKKEKETSDIFQFFFLFFHILLLLLLICEIFSGVFILLVVVSELTITITNVKVSNCSF